jgi:hypothetical protein
MPSNDEIKWSSCLQKLRKQEGSTRNKTYRFTFLCILVDTLVPLAFLVSLLLLMSLVLLVPISPFSAFSPFSPVSSFGAFNAFSPLSVLNN